MKNKLRALLSIAVLFGVVASPAQAGLISYTAGGANLVHDDDRDLTWVADANLFKTQSDADGGTAQAIIDAIGSVDGHTLVLADFNTSNGLMTWWGAMAWAEWLGTEGYGGANDWDLWSALNSDGTGPCGPAFDCTDSDLGHLFYIEGGLTSGQLITASAELNNHFINLQNDEYWSRTKFSSNPAAAAWAFNTANGSVNDEFSSGQLYGWAVRSGQVAAAPLPATGLLMAVGLVGIGVGRSRRRATLALRSFG